MTVGDRWKRRVTRGWLSASQQQTLSGRAARVYTCTRVHDNIRVDVYRSRPIGTSLLCLGGHGLHCSSSDYAKRTTVTVVLDGIV